VLIPLHVAVAVGHLDEADAPLGEAARHQALSPEVLRDGIADAVEPQGLGRLARQVLDFRQ
jgi:hypothetical protein